MKKSRVYKSINRNTNTLYNHVNRTSRLNAISPEVVVGSLWLQEDNPNGAKIIELNSSNSDGSPKDSHDYNNFSHAWSYINNDRFQHAEDEYIINKKAREKRRLKNNNQNLKPNSSLDTSNGYETDIAYHIEKNNLTLNHQMNCFTILNKHILDSDTASDNPEYEDIEYLAPRDYFPEKERWKANYRTYDEMHESENDHEKRTVWIYSFKNKHLLSENDFKHENLSSKETTSESTSCSIENIEEENTKDNHTSRCRVATPIPASYVPRLNLSLVPTLPNVSEVTEPTKAFISESIRSNKNEVIKRKHNGWFMNDNKIVGSDTVLKQDTCCNVIEWMCLSPRERRRRFKSSNINEKLPTLPEVNSYTEAVSMNFERQYNKLKEKETSQVVDADIHTVDKDPEIVATTPPNDVSKVNDEAIDKISSEYNDQENRKDDRGDHTRKSIFYRPKILQGPKIRLSQTHKMDETKISDPIDKLESDNWILEDEEKHNATYGCDEEVKVRLPQIDKNENSASRRLWRRNISLMKPPEWSEYLPISESPLFLHLSLGSLDEIDQPWYKRMFKIFKCCMNISCK